MARPPGFYITKIAILTAALREWKCPACGGSGKYQQRGFVPGTTEFAEPIVNCRKCNGSGQHPIATVALKRAEEVTDV
jgi:hypothetical protein